MRRLLSLALLLAAGCSSSEVPVTKSSPAVAPTAASTTAPETSPVAPQSVTTAKPEATPKPDESGPPSNQFALEGPSPDGQNRLTPEEIQEGWIRLFDGSTAFGWKANSEANWTIRDGVISADSGKPGLLVTTTRFADYELRCDFELGAGANSGLFLRTAFQPKSPSDGCYELNLCDKHPNGYTTGSLVDRQKTESTVVGEGGWKTARVTVHGPQVTVRIGDETVLDYKDETANPLKTGFIGLQMNGGAVKFRNVFLKPLGQQPLFDGQSLEGWHEVPGSKSQFTVEDGAIRVIDGRGFLESDKTAGNFVFQFQAKTEAEGLNSGVFFRSMKGTEKDPSNGYEFQIHNGYKNGDRAVPVDHGTGAIFKRNQARRVVANDKEWTTCTLVADGAHFSCWVNGIQVTDWTDDRKDNENPRQGKRLAPGHFSLQGHDPTTNLLFRQITLAETPE